jgi:hypothetical protein
MSGDASHLHMLDLIAGGIPASLEFYRRLGVTAPAGAAGPHVQGVEPDTLFFPTPTTVVTVSSLLIAVRPVNNGRMALDGILRRDQSESQETCCLEQVEVLS